MTSHAVLYAAVPEAVAAGLCVVPPRSDGSKRPLVDWLELQDRRPDLERLRAWYRDPTVTGIGVVCGPVSGDLEMFEAEDLDSLARFRAAMLAAGEGPLLARLDAGYLEQSPGGGVHWLYKCTPAARNHRVACRPKRPDEMTHERDRRQVLLETRGAGGYVVIAPSFGAVHPSGRPYVRLAGSFATIPTITPEERARLWAVGAELDEMPPVVLTRRPPAPPRPAGGGESPMERVNAHATWAELLEPHGWTLHRVAADGQEHWSRPGRQHTTSATATADTLYVFSSSTDFEPDTAYSKFAAYAVLAHAGDMSRAARHLAAWNRAAC